MSFSAWLCQALLTVGLLSATVHAQDEAAAERQQALMWLERMALALEQLSYEGTFVYRQGNQLQSMAVVHVRDQQGIKERLYSLDGDDREIRRQGNLIEASLADETIASLVNYVQFARVSSDAMLRHSKAYRFELGGRKRIASNIAQQVRVVPRDRLRYGYDYWLEVRTGMLLKQVMWNYAREPLEELAFTSIVMAANIPESRLRRSVEQSDRQARQNSKQTRNIAESHWVPLNMPKHFELVNHQRTASTDGATPLDHQLYSDGVAHVSVYIEAIPQNVPDAELGASRAGIVNIYNRAIDNHRITAIGAVPYETLRALAGSIMHRDDLDALRQ